MRHQLLANYRKQQETGGTVSWFRFLEVAMALRSDPVPNEIEQITEPTTKFE